MSNGCPMCLGLGRILAIGGCEPVVLLCPECAGLAITPASADDPEPPAPHGSITQRGTAVPLKPEVRAEIDVYGDDWLDAFGG